MGRGSDGQHGFGRWGGTPSAQVQMASAQPSLEVLLQELAWVARPGPLAAAVKKANHEVSAGQGDKKGKPEEAHAAAVVYFTTSNSSSGVAGILMIGQKTQNAERPSLRALIPSFVE